jgi:hypothetical protein
MKRIFTVFTLSVMMMACQPSKKESDTTADSTAKPAEVPAADNQLTAQEQAEGWVLLFDGQTTNGWRIFKGKENDSWEVKDGTLHCKPFNEGGTNKRADLMTNEQYENFELVFDWKISPQGNSGVIYRATEEYNEPYATGPEYQVLDDEGYPGDLKEVQLTGANYDMQVATNKKVNPVGEWNQGKIVVNGNHVEHWLNGSKVVEYELNSDEWKKQRDGSKWKDFPGYGTAKKGHIDLQDHGNEVWYKNIKIKALN